MKFYSQHGEDCLLWYLFKNNTEGFFIDVGAFDGIHLSNTFSFEQVGWIGICIEPHPFYFQECQKNRINSLCLNVACVASESTREVVLYKEELGLLSGLLEDREDDIRRRYDKRGLNYSGLTASRVEAKTLDEIINAHLPNETDIDLLSVDVEGTEIDVLAGLNFERHRPRIIVIETNTDIARRELDDHLRKERGYFSAKRIGANSIYCMNRGDAIRLRIKFVECDIEPTIHPHGERYTLPNALEGKHILIPGISWAYLRYIVRKLPYVLRNRLLRWKNQ